MCGILACIDNKNNNIPVNMFEGLNALQHRGQDSCGISVFGNTIKGKGLVRDVFTPDKLISISASSHAIGHVRYSTSAANDTGNNKNIQPILIGDDDFLKISMCHNGNLIKINGNVIDEKTSDSVLLLDEFYNKLNELCSGKKDNITIDVIWETCEYLYRILEGSYSLLFLIEGFGIVAMRDRYGIRPLVFGNKNGIFVISSESCAINSMNCQLTRDLKPGETILIEKYSMPVFRKTSQYSKLMPCLFEYIYFSRADSIVDKISVYKARYNMGVILGKTISKKQWSKNIDVIVPVPDSSMPFALGLQSILNKPLHQGLVKNTYIERTFIMENEKIIQKNVRRKLNANHGVLCGNEVLIVDDSIVRGNTSRHIVSMAKSSCAKNVYFASGAPPILYPNHYGIYIPTERELIANGRKSEDVADIIGASEVIYNDLNSVIYSLKENNTNIESFEISMFESIKDVFR